MTARNEKADAGKVPEDVCPICGADWEWADCHALDCDDGYYDAYEDDPTNESPGTFVVCQECGGEGGYSYCPNAEQHPKTSPASDSPLPPSAQGTERR